MERLDLLGHASSKAEEGPREPRSKPGWEQLPSTAPADAQPRRDELRGRVRPRDGRVTRDRARGRVALRRRGRSARGHRLPAQRQGGRGGRARSCATRGAEPVLVRGNVSSDARRAARSAALGRLDALVHSAATGVIRPALETEDKHWDWTLNANARALLSLARAAAPAMRSGAAIVAISSLGSVARARELRARGDVEGRARVGRPLPRASSSRRAGIRVNAVSGGVVDTDALDHFPNREQMLADARTRTPAGRMVEPSDIADAVLFLCARERQDDLRADNHRRRRLLAPRVKCSAFHAEKACDSPATALRVSALPARPSRAYGRTVQMMEPTDQNRRAWDEIHRRRAR